ncbi:hypothetical protein IFR05_005342 [Cadophora sp. M221]|nr:hypothetical protein IFR05_005342 [Cadophora sp. M221]
MWLLDTSTLALSSFMGDDVPPYAILSHTWGAEEVSLQDMLSLQNPVNQTFDFRGALAQKLVLAIKDRAGYLKIKQCCAQALTDGYKYAWVDTCCIDKTNSSELATLTAVIGRRTGIPSDVLVDYQGTLGHYSLAQTMSWASKRETTRTEDRAYSLLGLFNVNMPMLYGEGGSQAFLRLQLEIIKSSVDHSIFAWIGDGDSQRLEGPFASSPDYFALCGDIVVDPLANNLTYEMTNLGLRIKLYMYMELDIAGVSESQHVPVKQLMRTKSRYIHPTIEEQYLSLTEIYLIDPSVETLGDFRSLHSQSPLRQDMICRVHARALHQLNYDLETVENWERVGSRVFDTRDHSYFLLNVPGMCDQPGTLFFSSTYSGHNLFALHLSLKSDKFSWTITGLSRSSGSVEQDLKTLKWHNSSLHVDVAEYGEERSKKSSIFLGQRITIKVTRVIISGKHGFEVRLGLINDKES